MVFVREDQRYPDTGQGRDSRSATHCGRPPGSTRTGTPSLADELLADFGLPAAEGQQLSRGMRSALGIVIGLAARAEVTLFDEPYAGLDPVARQLFYDRLLADYAEHPRTVLLSTHLIDEAAGLLERVVVIDRGRDRARRRRRRLRGSATSVSGPAIAVASSPPGARSGTAAGSARRSRRWWPGALDETDRAAPGRCACTWSR